MPNVFLRAKGSQKKEAEAAKALLTVPDGDHLTLLNVFNSYQQSNVIHFSSTYSQCGISFFVFIDLHDKNWAWTNHLSVRALSQAENVRSQLQRIMERFDLDLLSSQDQRTYYLNIRKALVCGFFMQVAHKEDEKGSYLTVKDNQVRAFEYLPSSHRPQLVTNATIFIGCLVASLLWSRYESRMGSFQ